MAPLVLADQFAELVLWEPEPRRAAVLARVFERLGAPVTLIAAPLEELLAHQGRYRLVVLEDSYARLSRMAGGDVARAVARLVEPGGQCLVVTGNRWGWSNVKRACMFPKGGQASPDVGRLPSLGGLQRALRRASLNVQRVYCLYPDHRETEEMFGWNGSLPSHLNHGPARILDRLGLVKRTHNGLAVVAGHETIGGGFLDRLLEHVRERLALGATPEIGECRVQAIGTVLAFLRLPGGSQGVLRVALSTLARGRIERAGRMLDALGRRAPGLGALAPAQLDAGVFHERTYALEAKLPGVTAVRLMGAPEAAARVLEATVDFLAALNRVDRRAYRVDDAFAQQRLRPSFANMRRHFGPCSGRLDRIYDHLLRALRGHDLPLVWAHGDLNVGNVLLDGEGRTIAGIIDWDHGTQEGLPLHDLLHFLLSIRRLREDRRIGEVVVTAMEGRLFGPQERAALTRLAAVLEIPEGLVNPLLITYWAQHVAEQLDDTASQLTPAWIDDNFRTPLRRIAELVS
jgi:hypothetical protein